MLQEARCFCWSLGRAVQRQLYNQLRAIRRPHAVSVLRRLSDSRPIDRAMGQRLYGRGLGGHWRARSRRPHLKSTRQPFAVPPTKDRSGAPAVLLRSRVPGTAGNRREQPTTSPSVFAGFPACSRLFPDYERIGETGFEPATARPPAGCATRLRHSPWCSSILRTKPTGHLPARSSSEIKPSKAPLPEAQGDARQASRAAPPC